MTVPMIHGIPRDSAVRRTAEAISACEKAGHVHDVTWDIFRPFSLR